MERPPKGQVLLFLKQLVSPTSPVSGALARPGHYLLVPRSCQSCGPGYWPEELIGSTTRLQVSPRLSRAALGECLSAQSSACASALVSCSVERLLRSSSISLCE